MFVPEYRLWDSRVPAVRGKENWRARSLSCCLGGLYHTPWFLSGMGTELMDCVYRSLDPPFQLNVLLCVSLSQTTPCRIVFKESYDNALSMQYCS